MMCNTRSRRTPSVGDDKPPNPPPESDEHAPPPQPQQEEEEETTTSSSTTSSRHTHTHTHHHPSKGKGTNKRSRLGQAAATATLGTIGGLFVGVLLLTASSLALLPPSPHPPTAAAAAAAAATTTSASSESPSPSSFHVLDRIRSSLGWGQTWKRQTQAQAQAHDTQEQQPPQQPPSPQAAANESHQFAIVIDGGSTGSRMFVYRFFYPGHGAKREIECISSKKVLPGLSSLDGHPEQAGEYMRPLFEHAATVIPPEYQGETLVFIQATAGMRLISEESQEAIYDNLYHDLVTLSHPETHTPPPPSSEEAETDTHTHTSPPPPHFPFKLYRKNIRTLSGRLEGFYAALSVNYLTGRIDTHLEPHENNKGSALVGALDLGGSSTQIVFQHAEEGGPAGLDESDFWVQSYLAYGVDTIRYRLWSHLTRHVAPDASVTVDNPCCFPGHEEWFKGHRLVGTGDSDACGLEVRRMLWDEEHERCSPNEPCGLDGVRHPPLTGKFLAMSVFFFALDCMKQLGPFDLPHWPSPSIDEIETAAQRFCAQEWSSLNVSTETNKHAFTRDDLLPYRCVEVVYIHTLLKHGYGFPGDSRNVTFVLDIEGMEVEWTLGFALSEVPLDLEEAEKGTMATPPHHHVYLDEADAAEAREQAAVEGRRLERERKRAAGMEAEAEREDMKRGKRERESGKRGAGQVEPPRWGNGWQGLSFDMSELSRLAVSLQEQGMTWWEKGVLALTTAVVSVLVALAVVFWRGDKDGLLASPLASPFSSPPTSPNGRGTRTQAHAHAHTPPTNGKTKS